MLRDGTNAKAMYVDLVLTPRRPYDRENKLNRLCHYIATADSSSPLLGEAVRTGTNTFSG